MAISTRFLLDAMMYVAAGFGAAIPLLYLNVRYSRNLGLIDWPKARGLAEDHVPIVGPSLVVVALVTLSIMMAYFNVSPWVITSAAIIGLMGYFDDRRSLPALDKLFFQAVCALAVVYMDPQIGSSLSTKYGSAGLLLGALFMVAVMNAVNFIDGIDGLAGIVLLTAFGVLPFIGLGHPSAFPYVILSCVMAGALLPFLHLNVRRRKGFMGNVGSYFFSFVVAAAHLSVPFDAAGPVSRLALSGLCFLVPLADAVTVITLRISSGRSPFRPDKGHLHHRLVQTNIPLRYTLAVMGLIQLLGTGTSLFLSYSTTITASYLPLVIFAGYAIITSTLIVLLEKASRIRVQAYFQRLDSGDPIYYLKYRVNRADKKPITMPELKRLETKFATEIRVTDICAAQETDCLFIVLRTMAEPLKGISARLEAVIHSERVYEFHLIERGDFTKRLTDGHSSRKTA